MIKSKFTKADRESIAVAEPQLRQKLENCLKDFYPNLAAWKNGMSQADNFLVVIDFLSGSFVALAGIQTRYHQDIATAVSTLRRFDVLAEGLKEAWTIPEFMTDIHPTYDSSTIQHPIEVLNLKSSVYKNLRLLALLGRYDIVAATLRVWATELKPFFLKWYGSMIHVPYVSIDPMLTLLIAGFGNEAQAMAEETISFNIGEEWDTIQAYLAGERSFPRGNIDYGMLYNQVIVEAIRSLIQRDSAAFNQAISRGEFAARTYIKTSEYRLTIDGWVEESCFLDMPLLLLGRLALDRGMILTAETPSFPLELLQALYRECPSQAIPPQAPGGPADIRPVPVVAAPDGNFGPVQTAQVLYRHLQYHMAQAINSLPQPGSPFSPDQCYVWPPENEGYNRDWPTPVQHLWYLSEHFNKLLEYAHLGQISPQAFLTENLGWLHCNPGVFAQFLQIYQGQRGPYTLNAFWLLWLIGQRKAKPKAWRKPIPSALIPNSQLMVLFNQNEKNSLKPP